MKPYKIIRINYAGHYENVSDLNKAHAEGYRVIHVQPGESLQYEMIVFLELQDTVAGVQLSRGIAQQDNA
jgi:hypothetical protein